MPRRAHNPEPARDIPPVALRHDIACNTGNADVFHNDTGYSSYREAAKICAHCPARTQCLEWALNTQQQHGFWGGMTAVDRQDELRKRRRQAARNHLLTRPA